MGHELAIAEEVYKLQALNGALFVVLGIVTIIAGLGWGQAVIERRSHARTRVLAHKREDDIITREQQSHIRTRELAHKRESDLIMRIQAFSYEQYIAQRVVEDEREVPVMEEEPQTGEFELEEPQIDPKLAADIDLLQMQAAQELGPLTGER